MERATDEDWASSVNAARKNDGSAASLSVLRPSPMSLCRCAYCDGAASSTMAMEREIFARRQRHLFRNVAQLATQAELLVVLGESREKLAKKLGGQTAVLAMKSEGRTVFSEKQRTAERYRRSASTESRFDLHL